MCVVYMYTLCEESKKKSGDKSGKNKFLRQTKGAFEFFYRCFHNFRFEYFLIHTRCFFLFTFFAYFYLLFLNSYFTMCLNDEPSLFDKHFFYLYTHKSKCLLCLFFSVRFTHCRLVLNNFVFLSGRVCVCTLICTIEALVRRKECFL